MLTEISKYNDLGSKEELYYIINYLYMDIPRNIHDIEIECLYNTNFTRISIRGILSLLEYIQFIKVIEKSNIVLTALGDRIKKSSNNLYDFQIQLVDVILDKIFEINEVKFISIDDIKCDGDRGIYISNSQIPLIYAGIRNVLINLEFFIKSTNTGLLYISNTYAIKIKNYIKMERKQLTLEQLRKQIETQEKYGEEAEIFVLNFEYSRLVGSQHINNILRVSEFNVSAGYDIISYNSIFCIEHNRFIEVKSYEGSVGFYWSNNEVEVSKIRKETYYLYLVDRNKINNEGYEPLIIQNPYLNVFYNEKWIKNPQSWYIKPIL